MIVEQQYIDLFSQTEAMICKHSAEVLNAPRAAAFADFEKIWKNRETGKNREIWKNRQSGRKTRANRRIRQTSAVCVTGRKSREQSC